MFSPLASFLTVQLVALGQSVYRLDGRSLPRGRNDRRFEGTRWIATTTITPTYFICYLNLINITLPGGWTVQSIQQPVPSPDKRGGLASGRASGHKKIRSNKSAMNSYIASHENARASPPPPPPRRKRRVSPSPEWSDKWTKATACTALAAKEAS